jgi:hypothetical protein
VIQNFFEISDTESGSLINAKLWLFSVAFVIDGCPEIERTPEQRNPVAVVLLSIAKHDHQPAYWAVSWVLESSCAATATAS